MKNKEKKTADKSRIVTGTIILIVAVFSLSILYTFIKPRLPQSLQIGAANPTGGARTGTQSRVVAAVRTVTVDRGTIENRLVVNGDVLARTQVSIYPTVAGKLAETRVQIGDWVDRGQTVALVDPARPGELFSLSPVISTISGTVLSTPVSPGDTVSAQTAVLSVGDLSSLRVETFVPERYSTRMRRGLPAQIWFEAMPDELFPAEVDEVSPVLDPTSRTLRIRLRFRPNSQGRIDSRIKVGMFATISLVALEKQDAIIIPRSAAINTYGRWIVFVIREDNTAERREIQLGLESEEYLEALEGLDLGEQVVVAGQNFLSNNDPVRIVNDL